MEFIIRSKALYTTWVYYKPDRLLFDVGEGISAALGNKIYSIEKIFISHSHVDHIAGLWGFINTRNNAMGSREKGLTIYYPKGSKNIEEYLNFIQRMNKYLRFKLEFITVEHGDIIPLKNNRYLKIFKTRHTPGEKSVGFQILENRKRLKSEYQNLSGNEIKELISKMGKENILEKYTKKLVTISGDSLPVSPDIIEDSDILVHECTFIREKDRKLRNHTSLDEIKKLLTQIKPKKVILYHISSRYTRLIKKTKEELSSEFKDIEFHIVHPEEISII
ncbi:beta-lactamase [Marinitoga sp. 1135]|uniref:Metal-dependent hydrolase, beta-lactamase superfamily III n=1 Tax=Marinitoga piezophila (strain DSM 14283 / JCM 11233 / KA3) TaxID=443254 RepID=H2J4U8_MARPK|nr:MULTISPECIES: MBL fold metallo-hydrolase [Marinitoga]AEX84883.1 metal-dependent hydrolase, beta-lactamase superfamily III [Marinitoga piezophila KA3]APT75387.1 beta-lactamase [Marinitoga sp. 1137]NUU95118.1 beta-lactamase [Marinitoga sp. 1135]NUU97050.1 beta-lactamase [Marinitoga sp. 1138]